MRAIFLASAVCSSVFFSSETLGASAASEIEADVRVVKSDPRYAKFTKLKDKLMAYWSDQHSAVKNTALQRVRDVAAPARASAAPATTSETAKPQMLPIINYKFVLGQDFQDIGIVSQFQPKNVTGASASYNSDRVAKNTAWSVQATGTAALTYDVGPDHGDDFQFKYAAFGLYSGIDRISNSNTKATPATVDNVTAGGVAELGFNRGPKYYDWLRFKAGVVDDEIKDLSNLNVTAEWIPVYEPLYVHRPRWFTGPFGNIGIRVDPEIIAQFDDGFDKKNLLLFSGKPQSFRIGPLVHVWLSPFSDFTYVNSLYVTGEYHWYNETYSGRDAYYAQANLNYNLNKAGTLGASLGYQRGRDENTGKSYDLVKVSLTGKPCWGGGCPAPPSPED